MKTGRPNLEFGAARLVAPKGNEIIHFISVFCKRFLAGVLRSSKMPQQWSAPVCKAVENQIQALTAPVNLVIARLEACWPLKGISSTDHAGVWVAGRKAT